MPLPQTITLFGGTGFLGRHIVRRLAKTGARLLIATREPNKAQSLKLMGDVGQITPVLTDVRHDASVAAALQGSDAAINLIGILFETRRDRFQAKHVETAARIARLAKEQGVTRLVQISALGANPGSLSAYARSKAAGEQAVRMFFPDATILRPSIVYGAEDNFFNMFSRLAAVSPVLPLIGGGSTKFQPVYVGDVADAVMAALTRDDVKGQIYELGGKGVYSFRELLALMLKATGRKRCFVNLPWGVAKLQAAIMELLMPSPTLTRDQVDLLRTDNVIKNPNAKTLADLGVQGSSLELTLPTYLMNADRG